MGQAKARGTLEQRIAQAQSTPPQIDTSRAPTVGSIFVTTKINPGIRYVVDDVQLLDDPEDDWDRAFFSVELIKEDDKHDPDAASLELDNSEWSKFASHFGLTKMPT